MKPNPYEDADGNLVDMPVQALDAPFLCWEDAINLMISYEASLQPGIKPQDFADTSAARRRMTKKLLEAARRKEVKLFDYQKERGEENPPKECYGALPADALEIPLAEGDAPNTLETDLHAASMEVYRAAREGQERKFLCVTVEMASFVAWMKGEFPAATEEANSERELKATVAEHSDDDARALIRAAMAKDNNFISQKGGAKIVRDKYPHFNKHRAMALVKELTLNDKPGPKGPRNNRPAKIIATDN